MTHTIDDLHGLARPSGNPDRMAIAPPRSRWKTRILLPGVIFATLIALLAIASFQQFAPATRVRVVPAVSKVVEGSSGSVTVQAPGWLEPDPHPYFVAALAEGVVDKVLVLEGDRVQAGDIVARLIKDDARLAVRRWEAKLLQAQSRLKAAQAQHNAARLELDHLIEPSRAVAAGEALLLELTAEREQAKASIAVEQATLAQLDDEYQRKATLVDSQAVSEARVVRLRLQVDAQRAAVTAASARLHVLDAKLQRANADLTAARQQRDLLIGERKAVSIAEAGIAEAQAATALAETDRDEAILRLNRMDVRAPVDGIVLRRLVSPGSSVAGKVTEHSAHLLHLYDPQRLQVRVDVPLVDAAHVSVGQSVEVMVEVLPDRTYTGQVTRVVHEADIQKNTVEVKVAINNPTPELKPEMLARVRFIGNTAITDGHARQRIFVPRQLISDTTSGEPSALVVSDLIDRKGRAARRTLTLGTRTIDEWIEVESGIQIGDLLIADPSSGLEPGSRVHVVGEFEEGRTTWH